MLKRACPLSMYVLSCSYACMQQRPMGEKKEVLRKNLHGGSFMCRTSCMDRYRCNGGFYLLFLSYAWNLGSFFISHSAICTAFSAAPFLIWSLTSQKVRPLGLLMSLRIRPT